jgi:hypothetical protein
MTAPPQKQQPTGSHTVLALLDAGHTVAIVDNLSNSFLRVLDHVKRIAGPEKSAKITFAQVRRAFEFPSCAASSSDDDGGDATATSRTPTTNQKPQTKNNRSTCATARRSRRSLRRRSEWNRADVRVWQSWNKKRPLGRNAR